jgi:hypothetical protein
MEYFRETHCSMYDRTKKKDHLLSLLMSDNKWHTHYECIKLFSNQDEYSVSANEINKDGFAEFNLLTGIKILPEGRLFRQTSSYLGKSVWRDLKITAIAVAIGGAFIFSALSYWTQVNSNRSGDARKESTNKELQYQQKDSIAYQRY